MKGFLDAALGYIAQGFSVVILGKESKETVTAHTPHGLKDATKDADVVRSWWTKTPKCNVGAVLGAASGGIVVIDIDRKHGVDGYEAMRDWEMENGDMPETATACTPTGGYHLFYKVDREIRPSVNEELGVDVRGDGSYVVLPPSIHPDTKTAYEWEYPPDEVPIAEADERVYRFIEYVKPKNVGEDASAAAEKVNAAEFRKGGRNKKLYKMAAGLMSQSWPDDAIVASIETYNAMSGNPLPKDEVDKLLRSALSLPKGKSEAFYSGELAQMGAAPATTKAVKRPNHVIIADILLDQYSACYLDGAPAVFDGLQYRMGWDAVERMVLEAAPQSTDKVRGEVMKYLRLVMPQEHAADPRYIGFRNGVLDIETMELLSFTPEMRVPNVIPHDWVPDARSQVLDDTMRRIACGDPFIEHNLFEFAGLCLYRSARYAYAAVLLGRQDKTASNGKSTYLDLLRHMVGEGNYCALDLSELGQRFQQEHLAGMLANIGDDISPEFAKGASLTVFKKAVAGSEITTDVKGKKGYKFTPYCTMLFSANRFPKLETADDGVMRRLFPIRFRAHFTPDDPDFDPDIGEKLAAEECLQAAIVRAVAGLKRVIEQRRPTPNSESEDMNRAIKVDNSSILQWVEDAEVSVSDFDGAQVGYMYDMYAKWCQESGIRKPYAKPTFSLEVCSAFGLRVKVTTRGGVRMRVYKAV